MDCLDRNRDRKVVELQARVPTVPKDWRMSLHLRFVDQLLGAASNHWQTIVVLVHV